MNNKNFMILNVSEVDSINFDEVLQTSTNTLRKSIDGSKTFVKWIGEDIPIGIQNLQTKQGPYTHSEFLNILQTSEWFDDSKKLV